MTAVVIRVNGIEVTDDVIYKDAKFTSNANGRAGTFFCRVKDVTLQHVFEGGQRLTIDLDGERSYDGYVMQARATYAFSSDDTRDLSTAARIWELEGADVNILFDKRFVYRQSAPSSAPPTYTTGTADNTIIADLVANYLALAGDSISLTGVTHVGTPVPDKNGQCWNLADSWGQAMRQIAYLPAAVFYLRPDRTLYYADQNTEDAPFVLSDEPTADGAVGYQAYHRRSDGSNLINDMVAWGAGNGIPQAVVSVVEDAPSQTTHGRWEKADLRYDMYKQATINTYANRVVYGSAQHLRGAKDDAEVVELTTFTPGLLPGMKVRIRNHSFGIDEILPIRNLTIRFASPSDVIYDLSAAIDPDAPWSFAEFAPWVFPNQGGPPTVTPPPPYPPTTTTTGTCADLVDQFCGITDTFTRTVGDGNAADGWGTSDSGLWWGLYLSGLSSVDGSRGRLGISPTPGAHTGGRTYFPSATSIYAATLDVLEQVQFDRVNAGANILYHRVGTDTVLTLTAGPSPTLSIERPGTPSDVQTMTYSWSTDRHWLRTHIDATQSQVKVWRDGDAEPGSWSLVSVPVTPNQPNADVYVEYNLNGVTDARYPARDIVFYVDNLDISGVNRCTGAVIDDFNRSVSGSWGTSSGGVWAWTTDADAGLVRVIEVNGTAGRIAVQPVPNTGQSSLSAILGNDTQPNKYFDPADWDVLVTFTLNSIAEGDISTSYFDFEMDGIQLTYEAHGVVGHGGFKLLKNIVGYPYVVYRQDTGYVMPQGVPLKLRLKHLWTSSISAKIWAASDPEPADWTIVTPITGYSPRQGSGPYVFLLEGSAADSSTVPLDLSIDDIRDYVNAAELMATAARFDNFNRTVASGWGTSDYGWIWTPLLSGGATLSVDGSTGVMALASSGTSIARAAITTQRGGPILWVAPSFTMTSRVTFGGTNLPSIFSFSISDGIHSDEVNLRPLYGDLGPVPRTSFAFTLGHTYQVKWDYAYGATNRFKIWDETGTEPVGWTVVDTTHGLVGTEAITFEVMAWRDVSLQPTVYVDYIDFDYAGKPCYQDCGSLLFHDEFDRTTSLQTTQVAGSPSAGLGISNSGQQWYDVLSLSPIHPFQCDGGDLLLWNGGSYNPFQYCVVAVDGELVVTARLKFEVVLTTTSAPFLTVGISSFLGGSDAYVQFSGLNGVSGGPACTDGGFPYSQLVIGDYGGNTGYANTLTVLPDTWYLLKWHYKPNSIMEAKAWQEGTPEPDWILSCAAVSGPTPTYLLLQPGTTAAGGRVFIDYLRVTGCTGVMPPVIPGTSNTTPAHGTRVSEDATRLGAATYETTWAFISGSEVLYIDGVLQRTGVDFTESPSNPKVLNLVTGVASSATVWVSYLVS